jgi:hypothetical protein
MAAPAVIKQVGTGASYWFPDWMQGPFQVSLAAIPAGLATFTIDVTWDNISGVDVGNVGPAANANWFNIVGIGAANVTANYTTPVQAFRVNLVSSSATTLVTVTFLQGTRGLP